MHQMTPKWPQALYYQTYPVYTEYSPPDAQIGTEGSQNDLER